MTGAEWSLAVLGAGLGTYFLRVAPFTFEWLRSLGERYLHFLTYVSFAIAAGIVSKSLLVVNGEIHTNTEFLIKLAAVASALIFQRFLKNMPAALFAGVAVAVCIKWLMG